MIWKVDAYVVHGYNMSRLFEHRFLIGNGISIKVNTTHKTSSVLGIKYEIFFVFIA
jgi:hypothetical protein